MPSSVKRDRFADRMEGILVEEQILARDAAGASHRIVASGEAERFLKQGNPKEALRASDHAKPAFFESVREKVDALVRVDLKNHILFRHLEPGQLTPLANEAVFWKIGIREGQPSLSAQCAQTLMECYETICRLPREVHKNYPLYIEGYSLGHATRVGIYTALLAQKLGRQTLVSPEDAGRAGFFHDLGKVHPHVQPLVKSPNRLTDEEYRKVKMHPVIGATIWNELNGKALSMAPGLSPHLVVHDGMLEHHARPDGKGYPPYVKSESVTEIGKLVAVADSFDAMTSMRAYKGINQEDQVEYAYEELRRCSGLPWNAKKTKFQESEGQFDASLVKRFLELEPKPVFLRKGR
ncbi:HD domain-containing protein [Candidatus Peregrinibacteria bacterium]|nr:HD domain-containing protein [Candidatus Peregrinibacteria bacterium]